METKDEIQQINKSAQMISALFTSISGVYKTAKIMGTVIISGGVLSAVLAIIAATPFFESQAYEFISLTVLSAVFIISGCILFAFLANLEFKMFIASQAIDQEAFNKFVEGYNKFVEGSVRKSKQKSPIDKAGG